MESKEAKQMRARLSLSDRYSEAMHILTDARYYTPSDTEEQVKARALMAEALQKVDEAWHLACIPPSLLDN